MKDQLENNFKEALENFSLPYEPGAWTQLNARLNVTPTPLYKKSWFKISALLSVIGIAILGFYVNQKESAKPKETQLTQENDQQQVESKGLTSATNTSTAISKKKKGATNPQLTDSKTGVNPIPVEKIAALIDQKPTWFDSKAYKFPEFFEPIMEETPIVQENFIPIISKKSICLNDEMDIDNPYKHHFIMVVYPDGRQEQLAPNKGVHFVASSPGVIKVMHNNITEQLTVLAPDNKLYIESDPTLIYEQGIPTVKFTVSGNDQAVSWWSNVKNSEAKNELFVVHPFKEKQVKVQVNSADKNGCTVSETKTITMKETYNLLALTGFSPTNIDARLNRFMPYALIQRNTPFELIIIDTKNGATLFQTNDENNAWDGIDRRTGELVPVGSIWAWKVVLKYPQAGENPEYSGTITRL
jgi:hypothetical protein